ncbi:cyclodeaminase/cyclohydrolase family protein [Dethiosulfovibrio salsuginis]|uniref:Glutamate formiminotransferase / formiminotetrahydrofolate cyclodeaminase n=1 Tax=Dethiosulfovibrio salsuginis TaxID=561720 RepID=A0A1X7IY45_9BACT|nr:cyclodeaminase/cyclohydrolase family protein [Dethiosulfovibrio salsuginis]SMG20196.1 glutamate formiminotransferase / formiminotetrahydrofolate cyclodeaminase [Dethiosulfovibrio salsuginis]
MKLSDLTVKGFVEELASESPAPGGGSVAALAGSLGAALSVMVAGLTVGKEKYKDNWEIMEKVQADGTALQNRFLELMEEDTEAFNGFMAAMKMPKATDEEKAARSKAMQEATKKAIEVPFETMKECAAMVKLADIASTKGNPNAVTDAGSAAVLARAAAVAASYNVKINLMGLKDEAFAAKIRSEMEETLKNIETSVAAIESSVEASIS